MKRLFNILLFLSLAVGFAACSEDETSGAELELSTPSLLIYTAEATDAAFTIYTSLPWHIETDDQKWYTLSQTEGEGTTRVDVHVEKSEEFEVRKAALKIVTASETRLFSIEQNRNTGIQIETREFEISPRGGVIRAVIGANIPITASVEEASRDWLSASIETAPATVQANTPEATSSVREAAPITPRTLILRANRNYTGQERTARVYITSSDESLPGEEIVTVTQLPDDAQPSTAEGSNCYILGSGSSIEIPIMRSNLFWDSVDGGFNAENILREEDEWVVDVIWQDQPDRNLVRFLTPDNREVLQGSGRGPEEPIRLKVNGQKGNVMIGLHRKGTPSASGNYLWSWHIWVTDYNPDAFHDQPSSDRLEYEVPGGSLYRYTSTAWTEGQYTHSLIMDRNLGALSSRWEGREAPEGVLFYLYGRKDPMPIPAGNESNVKGITLYDINGEALKADDSNNTANLAMADVSAKSKDQFTYAYSVQHPARLLWRKHDVWCATVRDPQHYLWNNPAPNTSTHTKSLYDPCPEGWKLPEIEAFAEFASSTTNTPTITPVDDNNYTFTARDRTESVGTFPRYGYMDNRSISVRTQWRIYTVLGMLNTASGRVMTYSENQADLNTVSHSKGNKYYPVRCVRDNRTTNNKQIQY